MLELIAIKTDSGSGSGSAAGPAYAYPLDLNPNTELNIVWENPLFLTDRIPAAFSISFDLPATPNNLKVFNYPNRVPVLGVYTSVNTLIRHQGIIIAQGQLLLMEFDKTIQVQFIGSVATLDQKTPMNEMDLGAVSFGAFPESGVLDYLSENFEEYVDAAQLRSISDDPDPYCHAPVKTAVNDWEGDEALRGALNALRLYMNYFNPITKSYFFDPEGTLHIPVVPFMALHRIVSTAFGGSLANNPFATGDMRKLVIVANNHFNYNIDNLYLAFSLIGMWELGEYLFPVQTNYPAIDWYYKDFQQAVRFNEFFKEIMKIFGMTMFRGQQHSIEYDNDVFDRTVVVNWDEYLDGDPVLVREPGKNYIFSYQGENTDFEDTVVEYDTWLDVVEAAEEAQTDEEFYYKVTGNPQVLAITKTLRGVTNNKWLTSRVAKSPLGSEAPRPKEESVEITPAVKPLNMNLEQYWNKNHNWDPVTPGAPGDVIYRNPWMVPLMADKKPDDMPYIMFFAGMKSTFYGAYYPSGSGSGSEFIRPREYPLLTNHHTDHFGNRMFDFSLLPEVTDGIVEKFHARKKAWVEKDKLRLKGYFLLSSQMLKNLDMRDKIYLRGKTFYIEKIEFSLSHDGVSRSDVTLIET